MIVCLFGSSWAGRRGTVAHRSLLLLDILQLLEERIKIIHSVS
jgi:hypothetical protein